MLSTPKDRDTVTTSAVHRKLRAVFARTIASYPSPAQPRGKTKKAAPSASPDSCDWRCWRDDAPAIIAYIGESEGRSTKE
jgi:hypothetical protein